MSLSLSSKTSWGHLKTSLWRSWKRSLSQWTSSPSCSLSHEAPEFWGQCSSRSSAASSLLGACSTCWADRGSPCPSECKSRCSRKSACKSDTQLSGAWRHPWSSVPCLRAEILPSWCARNRKEQRSSEFRGFRRCLVSLCLSSRGWCPQLRPCSLFGTQALFSWTTLWLPGWLSHLFLGIRHSDRFDHCALFSRACVWTLIV